MKANSPLLLLKKRLKTAPDFSGAVFPHLCSCPTKKAAAFFMRLPKMIRYCKLGRVLSQLFAESYDLRSAFFLSFIRTKILMISTIGIMEIASPKAIAYSMRSSLASSKAPARNGTSMTTVVKIRERMAAPQSHKF